MGVDEGATLHTVILVSGTLRAKEKEKENEGLGTRDYCNPMIRRDPKLDVPPNRKTSNPEILNVTKKWFSSSSEETSAEVLYFLHKLWLR